MVRSTDTNRFPIIQPADLPQSIGHTPQGCMHLPFQQSQIQLAHTAFSPEISSQSDFSQLVAVHVKSDAFDRPGAEVKPCHHRGLWQF